MGSGSLSCSFKSLYSVSYLKEAMMAEMEGTLTWVLPWRRSLFIWETKLRKEVLVIIEKVSEQHKDDGWT